MRPRSVFRWSCDVNEVHERREADTGDLNSILPERQAFRDERALWIRLQGLPKLVGFTDQFDRTLDAETGWIGHPEAKLARVTLPKLGG